ncbi:vitamin K epoxide reductase family protein [Candidatus Woesearchaeota archaeon]|nr:vitamin K epoxide reductase family protein [Candidatus Woesearchaeota archaeon]
MSKRSLILFILILSLLGMPLTIYLTYLHFKPELSTFCNFNEKFNCDIVNKSSYAEILGIPVAIFGFIGYLLFFILSFEKIIAMKKKGNLVKEKKITKYILILSIVSFIFSLYLTFLEAFVIFAWCIFCLISATFITIILILSIILYKKDGKIEKNIKLNK